jgi:hypothetical protein
MRVTGIPATTRASIIHFDVFASLCTSNGIQPCGGGGGGGGYNQRP